MNLKRNITYLIIGICVLLSGYFGWNKLEKASAISTTIEWAQLAPFPDNIYDFNITTKGSSGTREFNCEFKASKETILAWLKKCPSLSEEINFEKDIFEIAPGGGAQFAEITVDWNIGKVVIVTYWS